MLGVREHSIGPSYPLRTGPISVHGGYNILGFTLSRDANCACKIKQGTGGQVIDVDRRKWSLG